MVERNVRMYLDGRSGDYVTLAFGSSVEELREIRSQLIEKRGDIIAPWYLMKPGQYAHQLTATSDRNQEHLPAG